MFGVPILYNSIMNYTFFSYECIYSVLCDVSTIIDKITKVNILIEKHNINTYFCILYTQNNMNTYRYY